MRVSLFYVNLNQPYPVRGMLVSASNRSSAVLSSLSRTLILHISYFEISLKHDLTLNCTLFMLLDYVPDVRSSLLSPEPIHDHKLYPRPAGLQPSAA